MNGKRIPNSLTIHHSTGALAAPVVLVVNSQDEVIVQHRFYADTTARFRCSFFALFITLICAVDCGRVSDPESRGEALWTLSMRIVGMSEDVNADHLRLAFVWLIPDELNEALGRIELVEDIAPNLEGLLTFTLPLFGLPPEDVLRCVGTDPVLEPYDLPQQTCDSNLDCGGDSECYLGYCQADYFFTPCQSDSDCEEEEGEAASVCHYGFCQFAFPENYRHCEGYGRFLIYEDRNQNGQLDPVTDPTQEALDYVWGPNDAYFLVYVESNAANLDDPQPGLHYGISDHLLNLQMINEYRSVDEVLDIELAENPDLQLLMCYEYDLEWVGPGAEYQSPDEVVLPGPLCESHLVAPGISCGSPSDTVGCVQILCTSDATAYRWFWNCSTTQTSCERVTTWESNGIVFLGWGEAPPTDWPCE